jgi:voltage-gated potassium channel
MVTRRLTATLLALGALLFAGTLGYMKIEGWSAIESLYMTVITLTTVGFSEVHALTAGGRIFTICLILLGVGLAAFLLSSIFEHVMSEEWRHRWRSRRRFKMIDQMKDHVIICGLGRMGRFISEQMVAEGVSFLIIEVDEEAARSGERDGYAVLQGSAADEETLKLAGIDRSRTLVAAANSDAENVFIVLTARELNPDVQILARAQAQSSEGKLKRAGADRVILPYALGGQRIVSLVRRPGVADFLDVAMHSGELELRLDEVTVDSESELTGVTLANAKPREEHGVTVLAIRPPGRSYLTTPQANDQLSSGSSLIILGTLDGLRQFTRRVTRP